MSPVFDSAGALFVAEIDDGKVIAEHRESLGPELPYSRAARLTGMGIDTLICGAISAVLMRAIEACGIEVIPFISGELDQVLEAYLKGALIAGFFDMPGFQPRHRNRFRGGRR